MLKRRYLFVVLAFFLLVDAILFIAVRYQPSKTSSTPTVTNQMPSVVVTTDITSFKVVSFNKQQMMPLLNGECVCNTQGISADIPKHDQVNHGLVKYQVIALHHMSDRLHLLIPIRFVRAA